MNLLASFRNFSFSAKYNRSVLPELFTTKTGELAPGGRLLADVNKCIQRIS
jgi:hypothetical protein